MSRHVALVTTEVSEGLSASTVRMTRIAGLEKLAVKVTFTDFYLLDYKGARFLQNVGSYESHAA
jgi:hypothetical protein